MNPGFIEKNISRKGAKTQRRINITTCSTLCGSAALRELSILSLNEKNFWKKSVVTDPESRNPHLATRIISSHFSNISLCKISNFDKNSRNIYWRNRVEQPTPFNDSMLDQLIQGDEHTWELFFEQYHEIIRQITAWPKWHFKIDAQEEVCQKILAALPKAMPKYNKQSSLDTYVKRIAIHKCIDEVKRQVKERQVFQDPHTLVSENSGISPIEEMFKSGDQFDPVNTIVWYERGKALKKLINSLSKKCMDVIHAYHVEGLSYKEIAERQGIMISTLSSRLTKCLEKLRGKIKKDPILGEYFNETNDNNRK